MFPRNVLWSGSEHRQPPDLLWPYCSDSANCLSSCAAAIHLHGHRVCVCACGRLIELVCVRHNHWIGVCAAQWLNWYMCGRMIELVFVRQNDWIGVSTAQSSNWCFAAYWVGVCTADWFSWLLCSGLIELVFFLVGEQLNWFLCGRMIELVYCYRGIELVFCDRRLNWLLCCRFEWIDLVSVWRCDWIVTVVCCCVWLQPVLLLCVAAVCSIAVWLQSVLLLCGCSLFYSQTHSNNFRRLAPTPCTSPARSLSSPLLCWSSDCTAGLPTAWPLR
jgi:uncharacterized membrane protein